MEKFLIQFLIVLYFWIKNKKNKGSWQTPSSWLLGIYAIGAFCGIFVFLGKEYYTPYTFDFWFDMLWFIGTLLLFLSPFYFFKENEIKRIILPNKNFLDIVSTIIILMSFYAIIFYSSAVIHVFSSGDLRYMRDERGMTGEQYFEVGIFNTIASVCSSFYVFALLLFFIYFSIGCEKKRRILLLVGSLSETVHQLANVGRDGIVFWLFSFIFLYLLFRPYLNFSERQYRKFRKIFIIGASIVLVPFLAITVSRFGDRDDGSVSFFVIDYMGQGFVQGPIFFGLEEKPNSYLASFPLIRSVFDIPDPPERTIYALGEWRSNGFSTFLSSFWTNFGGVGLYIIWVLTTLFFIIVMGTKKRVLKLQNIIIYALYFQVLSQGVFYFRQYTRGGNLFMLLCVIFSIYFTLRGNERNSITLYKGC